MLEGLTKYWGLYMVAAPDMNGVGVQDLQDALEEAALHEEWVSDLNSVAPEERTAQNNINSQIASKQLKKVLAARIVVFKLFLQLAIQVNGKLQEKHKHIWLLFQLSDRLNRARHPFVRIMTCLYQASNHTLDTIINRLDDTRGEYLPGLDFIFGLDEAQHVARLYPNSFISRDTAKFRSIIREIARVFNKSPVKLVVSGTGLSLAELQEAIASGVSKPTESVFLFHQLGMFDTWPKLKQFLERYIPATILASDSGLYLQHWIREYLLGR